MAKVGKFCLAKRVKVEWLFQLITSCKNSLVLIIVYFNMFILFEI